jgi:GAF domain-containing protein
MHDPALAAPWTAGGPREATPDGESWPDKRSLYAGLAQALEGLLAGESDWIANTSNTAASIFHSLPALNWVGFYFLQGNELVLGPFQGKPACVRIALAKGVCGTAARERRTVVVPDVHAFPGHIACDSASNSEVVVPIVHGGKVVGVLDVDSPLLRRFDESDARALEQVVEIFLESSDVGG